MIFASREDAGKQLGHYLLGLGVRPDLVLGLPRGGVVVAAEIAHILETDLDVLVVRKIGHPWHREFAVGALAEHGVVLLDENVIGKNPLLRIELDEIISEEEARLQSYQNAFHPEPCSLAGQSILLVDDGLATGATTEAAVLSARKQKARRITVAAPVASVAAMERLAKVADHAYALRIDPDFDAVGRYYQVFAQTSDQEVLDLLRAETTRKSCRS